MPYEYARISLIVIEASVWLLLYCMMAIDKLHYVIATVPLAILSCDCLLGDDT